MVIENLPTMTERAGLRRKPKWWADALKHLSQNDAKMARLILRYPRSQLKGSGKPFQVLCNSIIGQQISVKAADTIRGRIESQHDWQADTFSRLSVDQLREHGLARTKAAYLIELAQWFEDRNVNPRWFSRRDTQTIRTQLIERKGIGEWTWEMFAIFYLLDSDILPRRDVGLWKGVELNYGTKRADLEKKMDRLEKVWRPYCTAAVWFLWCSLDPKEINY